MSTVDIDSLIEKLAAIEHERWADWQKWCHKVLREHVDELGLEKVLERWDKQIATPYAELTEREKQSDRDQVARYLPTLKAELLTKEEEAYRKGYNDNARDCYCDGGAIPHKHLLTDGESHNIKPEITKIVNEL